MVNQLSPVEVPDAAIPGSKGSKDLLGTPAMVGLRYLSCYFMVESPRKAMNRDV